MSFPSVYLLAGLIIILCMSLLWTVSLGLRNSSIVDMFWGTVFLISSWMYFFLTPEGDVGLRWTISS